LKLKRNEEEKTTHRSIFGVSSPTDLQGIMLGLNKKWNSDSWRCIGERERCRFLFAEQIRYMSFLRRGRERLQQPVLPTWNPRPPAGRRRLPVLERERERCRFLFAEQIRHMSFLQRGRERDYNY
jgi:hypothetical protein